jgi:hypothetical protein
MSEVNKKATGRNELNKTIPVGSNIAPPRFDTEGTDAHGRPTVIIKDEIPTRIDEVNDFLCYLGYAEYGAGEDEPKWKIRRIQQIGNVWEQKYAEGEQYYRHVWNDRASLVYL